MRGPSRPRRIPAEDIERSCPVRRLQETMPRKGLIMYVARFSYDVLPVNRQQALEFIRRELQAAERSGLNSRILVPLTRGQGGGAALQFEVELANLDQLDQFRNRGVGSSENTGHWMHDFSKILTAPPCVEILRADAQR